MRIFKKENREDYIVDINNIQNEEQREWAKGIFNIFDECGVSNYDCVVSPEKDNDIYFSFNIKIANDINFNQAFWGVHLNEPELLRMEFDYLKKWANHKTDDQNGFDIIKLTESLNEGANTFLTIFNKLLDCGEKYPYSQVFYKGLGEKEVERVIN